MRNVYVYYKFYYIILQYRIAGNILRKNIQIITNDCGGAMSQVQVQYALTHIWKQNRKSCLLFHKTSKNHLIFIRATQPQRYIKRSYIEVFEFPKEIDTNG